MHLSFFQLFLYASIMQQCHFGGFNLLPLGQRVYEKLVKIIDEEMEAIGCQKMSMTTLAPASLWKKTGINLRKNLSASNLCQKKIFARKFLFGIMQCKITFLVFCHIYFCWNLWVVSVIFCEWKVWWLFRGCFPLEAPLWIFSLNFQNWISFKLSLNIFWQRR